MVLAQEVDIQQGWAGLVDPVCGGDLAHLGKMKVVAFVDEYARRMYTPSYL